MKYVTEKYEQQLKDLAETLCTPERFAQPLGQLVLFEVTNNYDDFIEGLPVGFESPPDDAA